MVSHQPGKLAPFGDLGSNPSPGVGFLNIS